ncbi:MAG: tRNA(Ile)(2)-agmatinylcytidine synthase [Halobacteriota archaeon]|nr:tRNA(Ile)(2)-agmatinylcytidine synthase [Halobacteriota archaeon]
MIVGFDDTDSRDGMCTTYLAAVIIERLERYADVDIPHLIRLNPTIKYKTRGNAAIALNLRTSSPVEVKEIILQAIEEFSEFGDDNTNPGVVFLDEMPEEVRLFSKNAIRTTLKIDDAKDLISKYKIDHKGYKNQRGLIGALGAVGATLEDFTYELIAYRHKDRWGLPRDIKEKSIWQADSLTYPLTWDTVDVANNSIVFSPNSKCPVLFGIRGGDKFEIYKAFDIIKSEPIERFVLFRTNQGTDSHLLHSKISGTIEGSSYILEGTLIKDPQTIEGGHVIFRISDESGSIDCAAYEPTKNFRDVIRKLVVGDRVVAYGSVKNCTVNLEKIEIKSLMKGEILVNPRCPVCKKSMKSAGKGQGYRCKRCNIIAEGKMAIVIKRDLEVGLYEVPPVARRHISKPLIRETGERIYPSR